MAAGPVKQDVDACPGLEAIAAFLDGRLDAHTREQMAGHLAACERCYFIFSGAAQVRPKRAGLTQAWWERRGALWLGSGLAAAAAVLLALVVPGVLLRRADERAIETLVAALGDERVIEPRLTGGFAYAPLRGPIRSGRSAVSNLPPDVRIAAARIEKDNMDLRTPPALHARGAAALLSGNIDSAVAALEEAAAQPPPSARILNDLGVAYLVRAQRNASPQDSSNALATLNRALEVDRLLPEARFNRAYALERLALTAEAREAWQAFLTIDDRSGWADEARAHLRALAETP